MRLEAVASAHHDDFADFRGWGWNDLQAVGVARDLHHGHFALAQQRAGEVLAHGEKLGISGVAWPIDWDLARQAVGLLPWATNNGEAPAVPGGPFAVSGRGRWPRPARKGYRIMSYFRGYPRFCLIILARLKSYNLGLMFLPSFVFAPAAHGAVTSAQGYRARSG